MQRTPDTGFYLPICHQATLFRVFKAPISTLFRNFVALILTLFRNLMSN